MRFLAGGRGLTSYLSPRRPCSDRSPVERLMDAAAGRIGFTDEIIKPWLEAERQRHGRLTFAGVERLRQEVCPEASYQATLNACVLRWPKLLLLVQAGMGLKNKVRGPGPRRRAFRRP